LKLTLKKILILVLVILPLIPAFADAAVSESAPEKVVKQLLNTIEHIKYLDGSRGLFRPDDALTRSDAARMFFDLLIDKKVPIIEYFSDLVGSDCYNEANALAGLGIFNGYDGVFGPEKPISRAEFVTVLTRFFDMGGYVPKENLFSDVPKGAWFEKAAAFAAESGFVYGNADGAFLPDGDVTRAETAVIMNRVLGRSCDIDASASANIRVFIDVPVDYWAFYDITEASIGHEYIRDIKENGEKWTDWNVETLGLPHGYYSHGAELFYVTDDGVFLRGDGYEGHFFDMSGRYISWNDELDVILKGIINENTTPDMTKYQKRETLYKYVRDNYSYMKRPLVAKDERGWELNYALNFFKSGVGNCYSFSAGYGLLLKRIGYNVNFIVGTVGTNRSPHGWVEVIEDGDVRNDDVELDMSYRKRGNYGYALFDFPYSKAPFIYRK
jgi:hypothetical protein